MCTTIAFTTGSGYVVPKTPQSKVFFIFYSIVSIAVTTLTLLSIGEIIQQGLGRFITCFEKRCIFKKGNSRRKHLKWKCFVMSIVLLLTFIFTNSAILMKFGYEFLDAVYLTIQIWTTIGFGDMPVTQSIYEHSEKGFLLLILPWTMCGLSLVAAMINGLVKLRSVPIANSIRKRIRFKKARTKNANS